MAYLMWTQLSQLVRLSAEILFIVRGERSAIDKNNLMHLAVSCYGRRKKEEARISAIKNILTVGRGCYNCWGLTEEREIPRSLVGE